MTASPCPFYHVTCHVTCHVKDHVTYHLTYHVQVTTDTILWMILADTWSKTFQIIKFHCVIYVSFTALDWMFRSGDDNLHILPHILQHILLSLFNFSFAIIHSHNAQNERRREKCSANLSIQLKCWTAIIRWPFDLYQLTYRHPIHRVTHKVLPRVT